MNNVAVQSFSEFPYALLSVALGIVFAAAGGWTGYWIAYVVAILVWACVLGCLGTLTIGPHCIARRSPFSDRKIFWRDVVEIEVAGGCFWLVLNAADGKRLAFVAPKLPFWEADSDWPAGWLVEMAEERGIPVRESALGWMKYSRGA